MSKRPRRERRPLPPGFGTIWTTVAIDLLGFGIMLPILPLYAERFGASPTTLGFLVASFSFAQFVFSPLLGRLSDKIGRKPVILISLFGTAVGSVLTGGAVGVWMLFLGRLIDGASGASVSVAQGAITDVAAPEDRPRLLGLLAAAFGVGFVVGPALGGLAALGGPRIPFFVAGAIAAINGLVAIRRLPETRWQERPPGESPAIRRAEAVPEKARRKVLFTLALVTFVATTAFSAFEATFSLLGQRRFDLTEASITPVFVGIGLLLVFVQVGLVHPVVARFGEFGTLRVALTFNIIGLLALAVAESWALLIAALALLVIGQGLAMPSISALVADRAHDERRGGALGIQQSASALARIVGPIVGGILFEHVGIAAPYVFGAALVAGALAILMAEREPRPVTLPA